MANSVISSIVRDGKRNVIYEVTGILDTSDYAQADITAISGLNPPPTTLRLDTIQYVIEDVLSVMLWWRDTSLTTLIAPLAGRGRLDFGWMGGRQNPQNAGYTGNVMLSTQGWVGIKHFTLVLEFVKNGVQ